jgi:hypothetical protein
MGLHGRYRSFMPDLRINGIVSMLMQLPIAVSSSRIFFESTFLVEANVESAEMIF